VASFKALIFEATVYTEAEDCFLERYIMVRLDEKGQSGSLFRDVGGLRIAPATELDGLYVYGRILEEGGTMALLLLGWLDFIHKNCYKRRSP